MIECHSCLLRCLRAIAGEALPASGPAVRSGLRQRQTTSRRIANASIQRRNYTADAKPIKYRERYDFQESDGKNKNATPRTYTKDERRINMNQRRPINKDKSNSNSDSKDTEFPSTMTPQLERAVKKELVYLKDPLKHANHVRQTLRENDLDKALALCRIASKEMQVIVSWNHTIDYLLARREVKMALKTYNEMKKRAQFPDSHTYVILLRGLAVPPVHSETVGKAVTIYHSLAAPNSRVVQSIIHTNAALKVCARGYDMDSLWGIASRIPDKGPGAADNYTFTTILNAIRENALIKAGPREDDDATTMAMQTALEEGRRIWGDVVGKWRKGDLLIDEELVCAMGRILLVSMRPRDWDDILSLVEQTMDIPRLAARLGTPARKSQHLPMPRVLQKDAEPNEEDEEIIGEFDKDLIKSKKLGGGGSVAYVKPSNNTLSLVMEACLKMAAPKIANDYWDLLTAQDSYSITPDMDNLNILLRLLRQSRSSTRVVEVLRNDILGQDIRPQRKTFRIAMSACNRDKNNPHVLDNASAILDMMESNRSELDLKSVQTYLDLSIATQDGRIISRALDRLAPTVKNIRSQISLGSDRGAAASDSIKDDALLIFRTIIGATDQLMNKGLVPSEDNVMWTQRRAKLAAFVTRLNTRTEGKTDKAEGKSWFNPEVKQEMRRESRQLRNFRRNDVRREKKASGKWMDPKPKPRASLSESPGEVSES